MKPKLSQYRSSRAEVFYEKGVLRNFAKFTRKKLPGARDSFLTKLQAEAGNFIKKETLVQVFSCEFFEISKNTFFHKKPLVAASASTHISISHKKFLKLKCICMNINIQSSFYFCRLETCYWKLLWKTVKRKRV